MPSSCIRILQRALKDGLQESPVLQNPISVYWFCLCTHIHTTTFYYNHGRASKTKTTMVIANFNRSNYFKLKLIGAIFFILEIIVAGFIILSLARASSFSSSRSQLFIYIFSSCPNELTTVISMPNSIAYDCWVNNNIHRNRTEQNLTIHCLAGNKKLLLTIPKQKLMTRSFTENPDSCKGRRVSYILSYHLALIVCRCPRTHHITIKFITQPSSATLNTLTPILLLLLILMPPPAHHHCTR